MASRSSDTSPEEQNLPETVENEISLPDSSEGDWTDFSSYSDLIEVYDTVLEVKGRSEALERDSVTALDEDVLAPSAEAYGSEGQSLDRLAEELEGDTLIVAFGLEGTDLPNYMELQSPDMYPGGNWWDEPEKLDADYLFDRTTYEGAVDPNGFESEPVTQADGIDKGLYLFRNS